MSPKRDDNSPGPASYNSDKSLSSNRGGSSYRFGSSKRVSIDDNESCRTPGPGRYETSILNSVKGDRGLKFGSKIPDIINDSPGPASYSLNYSFVKCASIALTIGKAKR